MKHKVGDKVKIRSLEWYNENKNKWGNVTLKDKNFSLGMLEYCGKEAIIEQVFSCCYNIDIDNERHYWTDEMFEETMEPKKTFEPFERIIIRPKVDCGIWCCDLFSHYDKEDNNYFFTIAGNEEGYGLEDVDVLPFEGNAHLVGTSEMPCEEVELKEGDIIVTFDNIRDIDMPFDVSINQFKHLNESSIHVCIKSDETEFLAYSNFCIPFSQFKPNNIEETRKHILCVKNGKLVREKV